MLYRAKFEFSLMITVLDLCMRARDGLRPSLNDEICQKEICDLLKKCWHANPAERPDFTYIRDFMRKKTKYVSTPRYKGRCISLINKADLDQIFF